jgi:hypothetical protein
MTTIQHYRGRRCEAKLVPRTVSDTKLKRALDLGIRPGVLSKVIGRMVNNGFYSRLDPIELEKVRRLIAVADALTKINHYRADVLPNRLMVFENPECGPLLRELEDAQDRDDIEAVRTPLREWVEMLASPNTVLVIY